MEFNDSMEFGGIVRNSIIHSRVDLITECV